MGLRERASERGREIGLQLKQEVEARVAFDTFYYHLQKGGHVSALHSHRPHRWFARVDIERFFYGIGRNRVAGALAEIEIPKAGYRAKWSTVRNPYENPRYSLPYGFVQSPILATLVLMRSNVGRFLRSLPPSITASVYMDDIAISGDDEAELIEAFEELCNVMHEANFVLNRDKLEAPAAAIELFNCDLLHEMTAVREERRALFFDEPHSPASEDAFLRYCDRVEAGNA